MKRLAQFAALFVMAFLMGQPVAEALQCSRHTCATPSPCPMEMSDMSADCPMAQPMPTVDCFPSCCGHANPQSAVLSATPAEPVKAQSAILPAAILSDSRLELIASAAHAVPVTSNSPPRFILNRVFRI